MSEFMLVDLNSQIDVVAQLIRGWPTERILSWLSQYGEVKKLKHPYDNNLYGFRSAAGIQTGFRLTEEGKIVIIGNHSTYLPSAQ